MMNDFKERLNNNLSAILIYKIRSLGAVAINGSSMNNVFSKT